MRTVKTTSGATAVQVVWSSRRGSREIEHLGPAHDEAELEALKAAAQQRIAAGQLEPGLGLEPAGGGPLPVTSSRMGHLLDALEHAYRVLGLEDAAGGDDVFQDVGNSSSSKRVPHAAQPATPGADLSSSCAAPCLEHLRHSHQALDGDDSGLGDCLESAAGASWPGA